MKITDQLDFSQPEHVAVYQDGNNLRIYITGINSSVKLTYTLQDEKVMISPLPPLQQS